MTTQLTQTVTLPDLGVEAVLRPARLEDAYLAVEHVDIPEAAAQPDGMTAPQRTAYQIRLDDMTILLQIINMDGDRGPWIPKRLVGLLSPDDMQALRDGADALKKKKRAEKLLSSTGAPSSAPSFNAAGAPTTSAVPT